MEAVFGMINDPEAPVIPAWSEKEYPAQMRHTVREWCSTCLHSGHMNSYDGTTLQYYFALRPHARGSVCFLHGFCECIVIYRELLYRFYEQGYSVFFLEQRGHGRSGRANKDPEVVYVKDFSQYTKDFYRFLEQKVFFLEPQKPHYLFAHSMGGAVGALFLEEYPGLIDAAILSSPMMRMSLGDTPLWQAYAMIAFYGLTGGSKKPVPGSRPFDGTPDFEHAFNTSRARYDYVLAQRIPRTEYHTCRPSVGWVRAGLAASRRIRRGARALEIPALLFQAGKENLVSPKAQEEFADAARNVTRIPVPDAKHEIYSSGPEILTPYLTHCFTFLRDHSSGTF